MVKAILFDLGNVLVPVDFRRCHEALARVCPHPPESVRLRISQNGLPRRFEQGEISAEQFVAEACRLLDMSIPPETFWEIWTRILDPEPLIPEVMLAGLRRRHRLLLLSNTNCIHFEAAQKRYPLLRQFDDFILSYQIGAMKPAPEIYRAAIRRAGCLAEECLFIDDLAENVAGALREGMAAIQFVSLEQLQRSLKALRILD
ncbi:MAG TPA: HAD family phosphatase [Terriglobia bacterium]|nr:HAD family phosphatase [Terriglobia bacterium]